MNMPRENESDRYFVLLFDAAWRSIDISGGNWTMKRIGFLCAFSLLLMAFSFPATAEGWNDAVAVYAPVLAQYEAAFTGDEDALISRESAEDAYR